MAAGAASLWIGLVFLAPYAHRADWAMSPFLYDFFDRVCHQIPERSFTAFGHPLAVCHRCLGLYVGFALGSLLLPLMTRVREALLARPRLVILFFLPMVADAVLLAGNTAFSRFSTGLVAAFPVGFMAWVAAGQLFGSTSRHRRGISLGVLGTGGR